jgi:hypothetical protein
MYKLGLALVLLVAACKEKKQEATPAPAPAPEPAPVEPQAPPPSLPGEAQPPAEAAPVAVKPAGGYNTIAEYETRAIELTDKLAAVFAGAGTNCDKLAKSLDAFFTEHAAAIEGGQAFEDANPGAQSALNDNPKMQERSRAFMTKVSASMQACQNHQGVKDALSKLGGA